MKLSKRTRDIMLWLIPSAVVLFLLLNFLVHQKPEPDPLMVSDEVIMYNADHFIIKPHRDTVTIVITITFIKNQNHVDSNMRGPIDCSPL